MVWNKLLFIYLILLISLSSFGKNNYQYIIYLKDKPTTSTQKISSNFTKKSLQKKEQNHQNFNEYDFPLNQNYIQQLQNFGIVKSQSNWLNAIHLQSEIDIIDSIKNLSFITKIDIINTDIIANKKSKFSSNIQSIESCQELENNPEYDSLYSQSYPQTKMLNGDYLHQNNLNGESMIIAICDGGFSNVNNMPSLQHLYTSNRLLGTYDYVQNDSTVYESSSHGTNVLSIMASIKNNNYFGTATKASYYLFKTEDDGPERLIEEFNLALALERCDQLGVDVVNISLGYTTFDDTLENHQYTDMNGNTTTAAKAVDIAAQKGILVCVSAGNEGSGSWKYIGTPADADSCITVAAVDAYKTVASFSSFGFDNDTRIKPNLAAQGVATKMINTADNIVNGNGTSFSSPLFAGLATCFWQAKKSLTNMQVKDLIEKSCSQYSTPNKRIGYGIPDFKKTYQNLLLTKINNFSHSENYFSIYPNPINNQINIYPTQNLGNCTIQLFDIIGNLIFSVQQEINSNTTISQNIDILQNGIYIISVENKFGRFAQKLIKQ